MNQDFLTYVTTPVMVGSLSAHRIEAWGSVPTRLLQDQGGEGLAVLAMSDFDVEQPWSDTHMVVMDPEPRLEPRPSLAFDKTSIVADGEDTATLTGLPDPCTVIVDDEAYEVTGGTLEIASDMPAVYRIEIEDPFPYLPFVAEITAHEAEPD